MTPSGLRYVLYDGQEIPGDQVSSKSLVDPMRKAKQTKETDEKAKHEAIEDLKDLGARRGENGARLKAAKDVLTQKSWDAIDEGASVPGTADTPAHVAGIQAAQGVVQVHLDIENAIDYIFMPAAKRRVLLATREACRSDFELQDLISKHFDAELAESLHGVVKISGTLTYCSATNETLRSLADEAYRKWCEANKALTEFDQHEAEVLGQRIASRQITQAERTYAEFCRIEKEQAQ
jgi:hypothetical protein